MTDPTPHARRSPMEHERDAGAVSLLDMVARLTEERDTLRAKLDVAKLAMTIDPWLLGYTGWKMHVDETVTALAQQEGAKG